MTLIQPYQVIENAELFDTFHFEEIAMVMAELPTVVHFFDFPLGRNKPEADTNLIMCNMLPFPERFEVESVGCKGDPEILACYHFEFTVDSKVKLSDELRFLSGVGALVRFSSKVHIEPGEYFRVNLRRLDEHNTLKRAPLRFSLFGTHFKARAAA